MQKKLGGLVTGDVRVRGQGSPGCMAAWFMDAFEVSSLQPHRLPAAFQSQDILLAAWRGGWTFRSPASASVSLTFTFPHFVLFHQCALGFHQEEKKRAARTFSCMCDSLPYNIFEGQSKQETDKEEKEVVLLWNAKLGHKRSVPTQLLFCFSMQNHPQTVIVYPAE